MTLRNSGSRTRERVRLHCWMKVAAARRILWARTVNVSGTGILVNSLVPLAAGTFVQLRSRQLALFTGGAYVRYCRRQRWFYRIGLEFQRPVSARF